MAEYFLTYDDPSVRGNWATYAYVDNFNSSINQQFITLKYYTDSSLLKRDTSLNIFYNTFATNVSVNNRLAQFVKGASIGNTLYWSGGLLNVVANMIDVSIVNPINKQAIQYDANISKWKNVNTISLNDYFYDKNYIDTSANFIRNASLSNEFTWIGGQLHVDVSVVADGASLSYVDGSLSNRDVSINALYDRILDTSISNAQNNDVLGYDSSISKWKNKYNVVEASTYFYTKAEIDALLADIVGGTY